MTDPVFSESAKKGREQRRLYTCIMSNPFEVFTQKCVAKDEDEAVQAVEDEGQQPAYNYPSKCIVVIGGSCSVHITTGKS